LEEQNTEDVKGMALNMHRQVRSVFKVLGEKLQRKRPLGRHRCRQEGNIKMGLTEIGWETVDWIHLV
jgi:hypothetical protein